MSSPHFLLTACSIAYLLPPSSFPFNLYSTLPAGHSHLSRLPHLPVLPIKPALKPFPVTLSFADCLSPFLCKTLQHSASDWFPVGDSACLQLSCFIETLPSVHLVLVCFSRWPFGLSQRRHHSLSFPVDVVFCGSETLTVLPQWFLCVLWTFICWSSNPCLAPIKSEYWTELCFYPFTLVPAKGEHVGPCFPICFCSRPSSITYWRTSLNRRWGSL